MNALARFVTEKIHLAWTLALCVILVCAWGVGEFYRHQHEQERLTQLSTESERLGIEILSQTLNGNLMGSVAMLGMIDPDIKREALGKLSANNDKVLDTLESVGRSYDADGVFIVAANGIASSSWDNSGKRSTGLDLKFRPYYQMAMQGMENIYAAVSIARGDRSLYFAAPVFIENTSGTNAIGAVVARTGLLKLDNLMRDRADNALLLSPQGVVFASSRKEWIGALSGKPTPERIKAIRDLKQFGNMFEKDTPPVLPFVLEQGIQEYEGRPHIVTLAKLAWNDPFGDWQVVLVEDPARSLPLSKRVGVMGGTALFLLFVSVLMLSVLRGHHARILASRQLDTFARQQQTTAARKTAIAAAAVRLQQAKTLEDLGQLYLTDLRSMIDAVQGAVYVLTEGNTLTLMASHACAVPPATTFRLGAGLLGQCAIERRLLRLDAPKGEDDWHIRSGLGSCTPRCVLIAPILLNDTLLGAVEVALMNEADADLEDVLTEMNKLLALNIEILRRSARTAVMLEESSEQAHFQQVLMDTIPYPVFYKGADARFLGFNRAYQQTFNIRSEDLIGKRVQDLDYLPEADRLAYQAEDEATIAACSTVQREIAIAFADGKLHHTIYFVSGFRNADGSPGGLVGTFIDISAQKEAAHEMDRLADLERFHKLAQGREMRIIELKREINALTKAQGKPEPYNTELVETVGDHTLPPHPDYRTDLSDGQPIRIENLIDLQELQQLLSNFCESVGIASAIIDLDGKVLAAARWQRACTDFHRVSAQSCARCIESDTQLALQLQEGQDFTLYKCKNGMTDAAAPIIIEGQHLANVFIGQFHVTPPDMAFFRRQAEAFGYDIEAYLAAVQEAPIINEARLPAILSFLSGFSRMISTMSLAKRRADLAQQALSEQADLLKRERLAALSLAEDATQAQIALQVVAKELQA